jgi:hypothetical protein
MPCYLLGVKVVRIISSRFWVWGGGEDSDGVIIFWGSSVLSVLFLPLGVAFLIMLFSWLILNFGLKLNFCICHPMLS